MSIRQLAPDVAAKIAAGEVVERPASVVKELIENSIDAGAGQIRVDLMNGGLQLIRVIDNGSGIPADELQLALARHATSKVAQIDDLEHIRSLGFRGEALASIAAVAEVTLLSRHREATQGAQVSASDGHISAVSVAASPEGTTLTVRNLFSAVPARLKFLKGRNTEISHCHHMLEQYALAYPEVRFSVFSEGRQIFSTPGDGQLSSVLIEIYGLQVTEQMVPISSLDGREEDAERPVVTGFTSLPTCYKSTRQHISFFVNRRWVLSHMLTAALEEQGETTAAANPIEPDIDDEATTFPEDSPWITVTEEETGTKPPLLSRLWQSHVHRDEDTVPPAQEPASAATGRENKQPDTTQHELVNKNVGAPLACALNVGTFH